MCTHMGSVNISLKKEAYDFLNSLRKKNQSFSEVILEFKEERKFTGKDLLKYAGALKDKKDWDETEENMKKLRKSINKRLNKKEK